MNAPPFPLNPRLNQMCGGWVFNGCDWAPTNSPLSLKTTVFNSSGIYQPSPGLVSVIVECIGGGGCGGSAEADDINSGNTASQWLVFGGGGGSGSYSRSSLAASLVLGGVNVTVGAGGSGAGPNYNGGDTMFGALVQARGGGGAGAMNNAGTWVGQPGAGGATGVGDFTTTGAWGSPGGYLRIGQFTSSQGVTWLSWVAYPGGSIIGGNTTGNPAGEQGGRAGTNAQANSGAGGEGALVNQMAAFNLGGDGGSGVCICTELCVSGAGQGCDPCLPWPWGAPPPGWGGPC